MNEAPELKQDGVEWCPLCRVSAKQYILLCKDGMSVFWQCRICTYAWHTKEGQYREAYYPTKNYARETWQRRERICIA